MAILLSLSLSLSGVCLTKRFHQAVLIEAICRGCPADVDLCLVWQVYTHKPTTLSVNGKIRSFFLYLEKHGELQLTQRLEYMCFFPI